MKSIGKFLLIFVSYLLFFAVCETVLLFITYALL